MNEIIIINQETKVIAAYAMAKADALAKDLPYIVLFEEAVKAIIEGYGSIKLHKNKEGAISAITGINISELEESNNYELD